MSREPRRRSSGASGDHTAGDDAAPDDHAAREGAAANDGTPKAPAADVDAPAIAALERARAAARGRKPARPGRPRASAPAGGGRRGGVPSASPDEPYGPGRDPQPVSSSLERILRDRGWTAPLSVAAVIGRWRDVVGDQLAEHCVPETFDDGALVVRADSTAWAMQVRLLLPQLQRRLDEEVGEDVVRTVTVLGPGGPSWKRGPRSVPGRGPRDTYG